MKILLFILFCLMQFSSYADAASKRQSADISKRKGPVISTETVKLSMDRPEYCLFGGQTGTPFYGPANYMMTIWKNHIIYIGESGGRQDYTAQRDTLKSMSMARGKKIVVAFGAMNKEIQPILDEYISGGMTQEEFFAAMSGREDTNYDITKYKEILDFIKEKELKALAIGLPADLVDAIEEYGEDNLSQEEKRLIPLSSTDPHNTTYENYIRKKLEDAAGKKITSDALRKHIHALAVLNETMAKTLSEFIQEHPGYSALAIVDNERLIYASGITLSAKNYLSSNSSDDSSGSENAEKTSIPYTTIVIKHAVSCPRRLPDSDKNLGGYVWYMDNTPLPENAETDISSENGKEAKK